MREIVSSTANALVDGTRWPGRIWPAMIALRNQSYNWRYIGVFMRWSRVIGGRNVAGTRFTAATLKSGYIVAHTSAYCNRPLCKLLFLAGRKIVNEIDSVQVGVLGYHGEAGRRLKHDSRTN